MQAITTARTAEDNFFEQADAKDDNRGRKLAQLAKVREVLERRDPAEMFDFFDTDKSGAIEFGEFTAMLPMLGIQMSDAKAFKLFKMCDPDNNGAIDFEEFKVVLFLCDPTFGNAVGFQPKALVTPMDVFNMFDEDGSGFLDEDEAYYALEYLGLAVSDLQFEKLFKQIDVDNSGTIDYEEFVNVWLKFCDLRSELERRGVDVPGWAARGQLRKMLREQLDLDANKERKALAEARRWREWQLAVRVKKTVLARAKARAAIQLRLALDGAGQVYVFGTGTNGQFQSDVSVHDMPSGFSKQNFDFLIQLWRERLHPDLVFARLGEDFKNNEPPPELKNGIEYEEAKASHFADLAVADNTVSLWGRRIERVAVGDSVIFALADTGEIYSWGGSTHWWHQVQPDSVQQEEWRGDTTYRSRLLLQTTDKELPTKRNHFSRRKTPASDAMHGPDGNNNANDEVDDHEELDVSEEAVAERMKDLCQYYNVWETPPNAELRTAFIMNELVPKIHYNDITASLELRGIVVQAGHKMQLMHELHEDITLEKQLLGDRAHRVIRDIDLQISSLKEKHKHKLVHDLTGKVRKLWEPLKEIQAEQRASYTFQRVLKQHHQNLDDERAYAKWRKHIEKARLDNRPQHTPRGGGLTIPISGITPRAAALMTPRAYHSAIDIAAGSAHALLLHKSGDIYTWGIGSAGRLGLDDILGDPQADIGRPKRLQALHGRAASAVACGYSHNAAIVEGKLMTWGSAANGKLGVGEEARGQECYCSIPVNVSTLSQQLVLKVSCGSTHTACITESGKLWIWGCGDGGRLGLGNGVFRTVWSPVLVEALAHETITSVSCGNTTTLVATQVVGQSKEAVHAGQGERTGGKVYMAGSQNVLGRYCPAFTVVESLLQHPVKQVSAGYSHQAVVTWDGELYTWGINRNGCCGHPASVAFVREPTAVNALFRTPFNLSTGKPAAQSSEFMKLGAWIAVDGDTNGDSLRKCTSTQQDPQPWWEVDLGELATIDTIKIWNRTDEPTDEALPRDLYTSRLFPCWVMVGRYPFSREIGPQSLQDSLAKSMARMRFSDNVRLSTWRLPTNTVGRYIRVQLETFNFLHLAQVEVLGSFGVNSGVGRVASVNAGKDVTVAVIRPFSDPREAEAAYIKAVWCDPLNAEVLRQFETYTLMYDNYGRGEVLAKCIICKERVKCEICEMKEQFKDELEKMPPGVGGRLRRLKSIETFLLSSNMPDIIEEEVPRKIRKTFAERVRSQIAEMKYNIANAPRKLFGRRARQRPHPSSSSSIPAESSSQSRTRESTMPTFNPARGKTSAPVAKPDLPAEARLPVPRSLLEAAGPSSRLASKLAQVKNSALPS